MVQRDGRRLVDSRFAELPALIPAGDLLVLNTTRVRHARLIATRHSGAPAEVLLIHPGADGTWTAIGKPGTALRPGKRVGLGQGLVGQCALEKQKIVLNNLRGRIATSLPTVKVVDLRRGAHFNKSWRSLDEIRFAYFCGYCQVHSRSEQILIVVQSRSINGRLNKFEWKRDEIAGDNGLEEEAKLFV